MLHRISLLTRLPTRMMVVTHALHIDVDSNEKVIPLSKFDLSKPMIGRTNGRLRSTLFSRGCLVLSYSGTNGNLSARSWYASRFWIAQSSDHWYTQRRQEFVRQSTDGLESECLCVPKISMNKRPSRSLPCQNDPIPLGIGLRECWPMRINRS